jgi:hypothetical protein
MYNNDFQEAIKNYVLEKLGITIENDNDNNEEVNEDVQP